MASEGIKRFASRVRIFLVGIVLFLLVANLLNAVLLRQFLNEFAEQFEERVRAEAQLLLTEQDPARIRAEMERWARNPTDLPRMEITVANLVRRNILSAQLLSPKGVVLAGTRVSRQGDPVELYDLPRHRQNGLKRGESAIFWPEERELQDRVVVFEPIMGSDGAFLGSFRVIVKAKQVRQSLRNYRLALYGQLVAILLLLALVALFYRWIIGPIYLVERTAGGEELSSESDPTDFLLDTYRKIITDLRGKEEELRRLRGEDRLRATRLQALNRSIVDSLPSGIMMVNGDGTIGEVNQIAADILDLPTPRMGKDSYETLLVQWPDIVASVRECLESNEVILRKEIRGTRDGSPRWMEMGASPLRGDPKGGVLLLLDDLTDLRNLERRMQRKEMLADLGELSAGVAHEFRNALGTILGNARLLTRRDDSIEEAKAIEAEVHALERVVKDFLRFADPTRLVLTALDLRALMEEIASEAGEEGVEICIEGDFPEVRGDETLLRRAFRNLIRNAVEVVPKGEGRVDVIGAAEPGRARIVVQDNGPGVPEEEQTRLFQPFFTTKPGGTGLGLALVRKIVLSHNGDIVYDGTGSDGARFCVTLPVQESTASER